MFTLTQYFTNFITFEMYFVGFIISGRICKVLWTPRFKHKESVCSEDHF